MGVLYIEQDSKLSAQTTHIAAAAVRLHPAAAPQLFHRCSTASALVFSAFVCKRSQAWLRLKCCATAVSSPSHRRPTAVPPQVGVFTFYGPNAAKALFGLGGSADMAMGGIAVGAGVTGALLGGTALDCWRCAPSFLFSISLSKPRTQTDPALCPLLFSSWTL